MANKVFAFEEKLRIYYEEIQNRTPHPFQTLMKAKQNENPWHLQITTITQLAAFGYDYGRLFDEFIQFKNDTNLEVIFKEKREYIEFWKLVPEKYKTVQKCAQMLLTLFASTYLYDLDDIKSGMQLL